ncbi:MAG: TatD family hydrolase, partial [Spirochaetaceae bacterium]|nr:TatD family hydrolase [Spirochaetaceae bacterium]
FKVVSEENFTWNIKFSLSNEHFIAFVSSDTIFKVKNMYIDSHTHYDLILEDPSVKIEDLFEQQKTENISQTVQISIDVEGLQWAWDFAKKYRKQGVFFSAGIHPSSQAFEKELMILRDHVTAVMNSSEKDIFFGVGECGLDYFRLQKPEKMQKESFAYQIELAKEFDVPVIVHSREAMNDTIDIIKSLGPMKGIMHCFPGDKEDAKRVLDLGFYISYAGNTTFKKAVELHESAAYVPLDRILVETDSPFLTPVPHRGKKNRPYLIKHTYEFIAELKKIDVSQLKKAVENNFNTITEARGDR